MTSIAEEETADAISPSTESSDGGRAMYRHFSTIGIGDVFLDPPDHPFLQSYLKQGVSKSFDSWEITFKLKTFPEDFIVHEIGQGRKIPGVSDASMESLRVARLLELNETVPQNLPVETSTGDGTAAKSKAENEKGEGLVVSGQVGEASSSQVGDETTKNEIDASSPLDVIRICLGKILDNHASQDSMINSLRALQNRAIERIGMLANNEVPGNIPTDELWIPPFTTTATTAESSSREDRGALHRALKVEWPLLKAESVARGHTENESKDQWFRVTFDSTFDGLIPFLNEPEQDLNSLYLFRNKGIILQTVNKSQTKTRKGGYGSQRQKGSEGHQDGRSQPLDGNEAILRLRPGLAKDERRSIHHLISQKCPPFETKIILDFPLQEEAAKGDVIRPTLAHDSQPRNTTTCTTTLAVVVRWSKQAEWKASNKRKRPIGDQEMMQVEDEPYPHTFCVMKKRQKEHLTAIQRLTFALRCRQSDIGLAGIKDKQAVTYQFCTLRHIRPQRVHAANTRLRQEGMELCVLAKVGKDFLLNTGDLEGNHFDILIRNLNRVHVESRTGATIAAKETLVPCGKKHIMKMVERIRKSGFINFYGEQRVGAPGSPEEVGVRGFDIGRAMLQQNFSLAVDLLMTGRSICGGEAGTESTAVIKLRDTWKESGGDVNETFKALPRGDSMPRERAVLKGLKRYGKDKPLDALRCLQNNMRMFWIHAYQSFVWNIAATERIKLYGTKVVKGDLYFDEDDYAQRQIKIVDSDSSPVTLSQIVLPLPGSNIQYPEHEIGKVYRDLLQKDNIKFEKSGPREATAAGGYRRLVVFPGNIEVTFDETDEGKETAASMKLSFELVKGSYATVLFRELMLATATRTTS
jgi:tRNA pseudouridine13 synthase